MNAARGSDRRAYRRIAATELGGQARIRMRHRPGISLVDLSSGGALIELPFRMRPESRVTLELHTSAEQLAVPFQLLRCYVADLKDGVRYHAAGAFDQLLKLPPAFVPPPPPTASDRLVASLEGLLRSSAGDPTAMGIRFSELLGWVVAGLRRGESTTLISIKIKARLTQLFPTLSMYPAPSAASAASARWLRDTLTSARYFGLDFKSHHVLSASDRGFLRSTAQLLALIDQDDQRRAMATDDFAIPAERMTPPIIVHSLAEWQGSRM